MGAGILPATIHNGKLCFLFGKENKYEDSARGFSDFGGGTDNKETFFETALREGVEESTGFLGSEKDIKNMLAKYGTYKIDYDSNSHSTYRMHIFPMEYNPWLTHYYNNNQRFLQKRLDPKVIKNSKIFEKEEIKWICVDQLAKTKKQFRNYFQNIIDQMLEQRKEIEKFVKNSLKKGTKKKTRKVGRGRQGTRKRL
jgi:hypothetical protein